MPLSCQQFFFTEYRFDTATGVLHLHYALDDTYHFEEKITFDLAHVDLSQIDHEALDKAFFALHLAAGIGYWKTCCPKEMVIQSGSLSASQAAFWHKLYTKGMGEFFYRNQIDFRDLVHFPFKDIEPAPRLLTLPERVLLPIGGGKDSIVSAELLLRGGIDFACFSVHAHGPISDTVERLEKPWFIVQRDLSPLLYELNDSGQVYNGHVPITAFNSFVMVAACILYGYKYVALSLERSADFGMVEYLGMDVNHQYSKSYEFEEDFSQYIHASITPDVYYFSLLRPYYELRISELFCTFNLEGPRHYLDIFASCNRNFKLHKEKSASRWCCECEKCAFVFLIMAPYLPKQRLVETFGENLFAKESLLETYKELLGISGHKPFECVGTPEESSLAFYHAHQKGEYQGDLAMTLFQEYVLPKLPDIPSLEKDVLSTHMTNNIPSLFRTILD